MNIGQNKTITDFTLSVIVRPINNAEFIAIKKLRFIEFWSCISIKNFDNIESIGGNLK